MTTTTLRTASVRTMLVDCIKSYKQIHGDWYERPYTEVQIKEWLTTSEGMPSVEDITDYCLDAGYDTSEVFVDGNMTEDFDGYPDYSVVLVARKKATDKEWFDEIVSALSPQWEYDRYKQYVELEKEFK